MNEMNLKRLEYDKIKNQLITFTISSGGRSLAEQHQPSPDEAVVREWLEETSEAAALLAAGSSVPLSAMEGIEPFLAALGRGRIYNEKELGQLTGWLSTVGQMKRYMDAKRQIAPTISSYCDSLNECPALREHLERCIRNGALTDQASAALADARRHIVLLESKIERKVSQTLGKYKHALQEHLVSQRHGHYVLPVRRDFRKQVPGTVWDESASGQTLFIEPADVAELHTEWQMWKAEEERERMMVLSELSEMVESQGSKLKANLEVMASLDFIFARAKLSRTWDGIRVRLSAHPVIKLVDAKHPLLGKECKPLNVSIGRQWRQLIITGPNSGGKTVTLKTIGLLTLMVQSGLLIPAGEGTVFGIFEHVMADVGDGQSIEHSLSTFSAHMANLKEMLEVAGGRSLLLLDELAAGTDPGEGIALSIALLEEFLRRGSLVAATTHFNEIKRFAAQTPGCTNARMVFDPETLRSLYRLEIGEAGDSFAFAIARRFGLPEHVVVRAEERATAGRADGSGERPEAGSVVEFIPLPDDDEEEISRGSMDASQGEELSQQAAGTGSLRQEPGADRQQPAANRPLQVGDSIWILPLKCTGTIQQLIDAKEEAVVQVMGKKLTISHRFLSLDLPVEESH